MLFRSDTENWITTTATVPAATTIGQFYYRSDTKACYVSTGLGTGNWTAYTPSKVTLAWNPFTLTGTGSSANVQIAGWNVYRREVGKEYNFSTGFLSDANSTSKMTIANSGTLSFTDSTAIAGKVYYYTVRPVDNIRYIATNTPEIFSEVRVIAPPANYTFAHRWMINQEICNKMNMTTSTTNKVDPTHNYRCPYVGPGDTLISGVRYYDYGKDLLVDISEAGCPYTAAPACSNNGCVGMGAPTGISAIGDSVYYDRSSGLCYQNDTGAANAAWTTFNSIATYITATANSLNSSLNPPLTNISNLKATAICAARTVPTLSGATIAASTVSLPEKKDYMAYSGTPIGMSDPIISELEQGFSLDIQSRCNGSSASGVTSAFTDSVIPSSTLMFSLPGTSSSQIRSVVTGSAPVSGVFASTESCVSRFGGQDLYGNVAEWVKDSMTCLGASGTSSYTCSSVAGTDMYYDFGAVSGVPSPAIPAAFSFYGFNNITGPFYDKNSSGQPDATGTPDNDDYLTEWNYSDRLYGAGNFTFPLGLPLHTDIANTTTNLSSWAVAGMAPNLMDIGVGITTAQLHEDGIIVNAEAVAAAPVVSGAQGYFAVGGSYLSGARSGRFTMELIPQNVSTRPDVGFRCIVPVTNAHYSNDNYHAYKNNYND